MKSNSPGFTLVEMMVVIVISALLAGLSILYSSTSRNAVAVNVEEGKLAQVILEAKELAANTYGAPGSGICGYGVVINANANPQTYSLFAYEPPLDANGHCPTADEVAAGNGSIVIMVGGMPQSFTLQSMEKQYTPGTWQALVSQGVIIQTINPSTNAPYADNLESVLFYPPDPTVFLSSDNATFPDPAELTIHLQSSDQKTNATISVNPEGQVNFQ